MTFTQQLLTIGVVILGTMLTRFLPFLLFPPHKPTPPLVHDLGRLLPGAVFALLVVYCLKNVSLTAGSHGIPEAIAIAVVVALHLWKRQTLLSIAGGTVVYMLLVQGICIRRDASHDALFIHLLRRCGHGHIVDRPVHHDGRGIVLLHPRPEAARQHQGKKPPKAQDQILFHPARLL